MRRQMLTSGVAMMALAGALGFSACTTFSADETLALLDRPQVEGDVPDITANEYLGIIDRSTMRFVTEDEESGGRFYIGRDVEGGYCVFAHTLDNSEYIGACSSPTVTVESGGRLPDFRLITGGPTPSAPDGYRAIGGGIFVKE